VTGSLAFTVIRRHGPVRGMVEFPNGVDPGWRLTSNEGTGDRGLIILGDYLTHRRGTSQALGTFGRPLRGWTPCRSGASNPLGQPALTAKDRSNLIPTRPVEIIATGVAERKPVTEPFAKRHQKPSTR